MTFLISCSRQKIILLSTRSLSTFLLSPTCLSLHTSSHFNTADSFSRAKNLFGLLELSQVEKYFQKIISHSHSLYALAALDFFCILQQNQLSFGKVMQLGELKDSIRGFLQTLAQLERAPRSNSVACIQDFLLKSSRHFFAHIQ